MDMVDIDGVLGVDYHFDSAITEAFLTCTWKYISLETLILIQTNTCYMRFATSQSDEESAQMQVREDMQFRDKAKLDCLDERIWIR
jgi:hypothetical protein